MEHGPEHWQERALGQSTWWPALEAIAILIAAAAVLALIVVRFRPEEQTGLGWIFESQGKAWLAAWAILASLYAYDTLVLRFSALRLSAWGYVWRTPLIAAIGNWLGDGLEALVPWEPRPLEYLLVLMISPWVLVWIMLRIEAKRRPQWSGE